MSCCCKRGQWQGGSGKGGGEGHGQGRGMEGGGWVGLRPPSRRDSDGDAVLVCFAAAQSDPGRRIPDSIRQPPSRRRHHHHRRRRRHHHHRQVLGQWGGRRSGAADGPPYARDDGPPCGVRASVRACLRARRPGEVSGSVRGDGRVLTAAACTSCSE